MPPSEKGGTGRERNVKNDNNTYTTTKDASVTSRAIKPYKIKRLRYANNKTFWPNWNAPGPYFSSIYILATCMCLSRFSGRECKQMLVGWHNRHNFMIDYAGIDSVIKDAKEFTREKLQDRKRLENSKYRAKQKLIEAMKVVSHAV
jgi:hypothetical protein